MVLQAEVALGQTVGLIVNRLLAVPGDLDAAAVRDDAHVIPLAGGLRHILCRGDDVVERTGRAFGRLPTVVSQDLQLVPGEGGVFFQRRTDKDAAIAAVVDGVVEFEDEIAVLLFGAQPGTALCRVRAPILAVAPDEHAVFDLPLASVHDDPAGEVMAVEKRFRLRPAACR